MAKIDCPNCKKLVPVRPPSYRCTECDYPLNKKIVQEASINIEVGPALVDDSKYDWEETQLSLENNEFAQQEAIPIAPAPTPVEPTYIKLQDNPNPDRKNDLVAGWLIVHTEHKPPVSYELYVGDNFFGTPADGYLVDIPIEGDRYVSRCHANLRVSKDFLHRFHYELFDNGSRRPQGPSTNGTYINGNSQRLSADTVVFLMDGDTLQIGETKLVFKNVQEVATVEEAATEVLQTDFTKTVILSKP